jgi:hypothetical protein
MWSGKTRGVELRILGPLEVADEAGPVALGTVKERVVLAVLLSVRARSSHASG